MRQPVGRAHRLQSGGFRAAHGDPAGADGRVSRTARTPIPRIPRARAAGGVRASTSRSPATSRATVASGCRVASAASRCRYRGVRIESTVPIRRRPRAARAALEVALCERSARLPALPPTTSRSRSSRSAPRWNTPACAASWTRWRAARAIRNTCCSSIRAACARPLLLPRGTSIPVVDSNTPRALADTAYNERRRSARRRPAGWASASCATQDVALAASCRRHRPSRAARDQRERARAGGRGGDAGRFGELMDASHASPRDDFDLGAGAGPAGGRCARSLGVGWRLTGAGFGGACVARSRRRRSRRSAIWALRDHSSAGFHGTALV